MKIDSDPSIGKKIIEENEREKIAEEIKGIKKYDDFVIMIKEIALKDILYSDIYLIKKYKFGKKVLYMVNINKGEFSEDNMKRLANKYNWEKYINNIVVEPLKVEPKKRKGKELMLDNDSIHNHDR